VALCDEGQGAAQFCGTHGGHWPDQDKAGRTGCVFPQSALLTAARAPRAAKPPPRRRAARLRIFVVGYSLPCDPPVGGHSCNGGSYHASTARSVLRPIGSSSESLRMTASVQRR